MMIPASRDLVRTTGLSPSKLYMGVSFASIIGGIMALIGTSVNLIVAGLTSDAIASGKLVGMKPLGIFDPIWVGVPVTGVGVLFMILVGTRLLPGNRRQEAVDPMKRLYRVEFRVESTSALDGKTLEEVGLARLLDYQLQSISRKGRAMTIAQDLRLRGEDRWPWRHRSTRRPDCGR